MAELCGNVLMHDKYKLLEEVGRGGMGEVWRAQVLSLDMPCAIKFILPELARDESVRARFFREARVAARLQTPYTVNIIDVGEWEGRPFMVMEWLHGESLAQRIERLGSLSLEETCEIIGQVALGLQKAHAANLVHRDLKPENIHVVDDHPLLIKILDFGVAKNIDSKSALRTVTGTLVGTPLYMSPEQVSGEQEVTFRSDLWALGVLVFECLTGGHPFDSTTLTGLLAKIIAAPMPSLRSRRPELPSAVDEWWLSVMQREPKGRPASALEFAEGLRRASALSSLTSTSVATSAKSLLSGTFKPVSSVRIPTHKNHWFAAAVAAGVLGLGGWVAYSLTHTTNPADLTDHDRMSAATNPPAPDPTPSTTSSVTLNSPGASDRTPPATSRSVKVEPVASNSQGGAKSGKGGHPADKPSKARQTARVDKPVAGAPRKQPASRPTAVRTQPFVAPASSTAQQKQPARGAKSKEDLNGRLGF